MRYVAPYGTTDPDAGYVNGNPATGIQGSIPPAEAFENHLRELAALIEKSGNEPTPSDLQQVLKSVRSQRLNYAVDVGAVNNMVAVFDPVFDILTPGLPIRVKAAFTNTSVTTTITVDSIGPVPVKRCNGAALDIGDISAGEVCDLVYDGTNFQLVNFRGFTSTVQNTNNYFVEIPYVADSNASVNAITALFSPAIATVAAGDLVLVLINGTNTGNVTITVNALAAKEVRTVDLFQLQPGQLVNGMIALLCYDGTQWQLFNPAIPRTGAGGGTNVLIAKRFTYQDPLQRNTTVQHPDYVEAYRVTYAPVTPGNKLWIQINGVCGSGFGNQSAGKRNVVIYMSYSIDGGSTWNPPVYPGHDFPTIGSFMANTVFSVWECPSTIITEREECYLLSGELIVPAGPPNIIVRVMFAVGAANCPDALLKGGSMIHIIEYTPGPG